MYDIEQFYERNALHDYEVGQINIDYVNGNIKIILFTRKREKCEININNFSSISFSKNEPWGIGKYIFSSGIIENDNELKLELQLNSSDICAITFARFNNSQ